MPTCPPAAQAATSAYVPSSLMSRLAAVVTRRHPVAPNGWPIESEPPQRLNLSSGISPSYRYECVHMHECVTHSTFHGCHGYSSWPCWIFWCRSEQTSPSSWPLGWQESDPTNRTEWPVTTHRQCNTSIPQLRKLPAIFFYKILETGWCYYGHCCYRQQSFHPWYSHYDDCNDICLGNSKITTGNLLAVCIPSIQCTCLSLLLIFNLLQRLHDTRRHRCQRSASLVGPGALEWHMPAWKHGNVESSQTQSNMYTRQWEKVSDTVVLLQSA